MIEDDDRINQECPHCHTEHWVKPGKYVEVCDVCGYPFQAHDHDLTADEFKLWKEEK